MYIEKVNSPADVKKLSVSEMNGLGGEIRQVLLNFPVPKKRRELCIHGCL